MQNHLIIGLGGTGGKTIRAIRKLMFQSFRNEEPTDVRIGYLYVDSSPSMMAADDPSWRILGQSVQLPAASQLQIRGENLRAILDNVQGYPGIQPWIGEKPVWREVLDSVVGDAAGGQKRRLGRFLFASKIAEFRNRVQARVNDLRAETANQDVTFHVVCGLAGGTGGGSIVDTLAQLREMYPESPNTRYRIIAYTLLPDEQPLPNWDTGNYHANGYAALLDLNGMSTGAYQPWDVVDGRRRLPSMTAFNGCYVFTNVNDKGVRIDVDKEMPTVLADFLFHKIVIARRVAWEDLHRMENAENGNSSPEATPGAPVGERSVRFLGFGIKRLAIPEEEITEFLSLHFAQQVVRQLESNNWQDGVGFAPEPRNQDLSGFLKDPNTLKNWKLTDDHLMLSVNVLPLEDQSRKWRTIQQDWELAKTGFAEMVKDEDKAHRLNKLAKLFQTRFEEQFRSLGVIEFYRSSERAKKDIAREVRQTIEAELFSTWESGQRSMAEVQRLVEALIIELEERDAKLNDQLGKHQKAEAAAQAQVQEVSTEWNNRGLLGILKAEKLFTRQLDNLFLLYLARTRIEATRFARTLIKEIGNEVYALKQTLDQITLVIASVGKRVQDGIESRMKSAQADEDHVIRYYDPAIVKDVARTLITDEQEQKTQTLAVRAKIIERLGEAKNFTTFVDRIDQWQLQALLESTCEVNARSAHQRLIVESRRRVLGVSIIDKLKQEYGADDGALRLFVLNIVNSASRYLTFNSAEIRRVPEGGNAARQYATESLAVLLPRAPSEADFVARLKQAFASAWTGASSVVFLETDDRPNEITLVSLVNLFPLRFLQTVGVLKDRYERRIQDGGARAVLEVHSESNKDTLPDLFPPVTAPDTAVCYLLLGVALGHITAGRNKRTNVPEVKLTTVDADGIEEEHLLGKDMLEVPDQLSAGSLNRIRDLVNKSLASREWLHEDRRLELVDRVKEQLDAVKAARDGDLQDETYKLWAQGTRKANGLLKRELV